MGVQNRPNGQGIESNGKKSTDGASVIFTPPRNVRRLGMLGGHGRGNNREWYSHIRIGRLDAM
jgi:hypothetical protein